MHTLTFIILSTQIQMEDHVFTKNFPLYLSSYLQQSLGIDKKCFRTSHVYCLFSGSISRTGFVVI